MSDWRKPKSLVKLCEQLDAIYPNRRKPDEFIGDEAHQAGISDHNPNSAGVVTAVDIKHDPAHGFDSYAFADLLRVNRDPRIKYIISNRRIANPSVQNWAWRVYTRPDPHTDHIHISVSAKPELYDSDAKWALADGHTDTDEEDQPPEAAAYPYKGHGAWFSQYQGRYSWVDADDAPNSNALGVPDAQQGIALLDRASLGKYFDVLAPNGISLRLRHTDIGPAARTGRLIDIAAVAAEAFGYSPATFPTDEGYFYWRPATQEPTVTTPSPSTVNVDVKPALQSKVNWTGLAIALFGVWEAFGLPAIPDNLKSVISTTVPIVGGLLVVALRTWFTKSVSTQVASKL